MFHDAGMLLRRIQLLPLLLLLAAAGGAFLLSRDAARLATVAAEVTIVASILAVFQTLVTLLSRKARARSSASERLDSVATLRGLAEAMKIPVGREMQRQVKALAPVRWESITDPRVSHTAFPTRGNIKDLSATFFSLTRQRLLILGEPGSGKSVCALEIAWDTISTALASTEPRVAIPLRVARWDPVADRNFMKWICTEVDRLYPRQSPQTDELPTEGLVLSGQIIPILEGIDEVSPLSVKALFEAINEAMAPHGAFIATCRSSAYEAAQGAGAVQLTETMVIRLEPLNVAELQTILGSSGSDDRWAPVYDKVETEPLSPVALTVTRPLFAWLASIVYKEETSRPAVLTEFSDEIAVRTHLLDLFLPSSIPRNTGARVGGRTLKLARSTRWLKTIADFLGSSGKQDFAWWELTSTRRSRHAQALTGVVGGIVAAASLLISLPLGAGLCVGFLIGSILGLSFTIAYGEVRLREAQRTRAAGVGFRNDALAGLAAARFVVIVVLSAVAIVIGVGGASLGTEFPVVHVDPGLLALVVAEAIVLALLTGAVLGGLAAVILQMVTRLNERVAAAVVDTPMSTFSRDRQGSLAVGIIFLVACGLLGGCFTFALTHDPLVIALVSAGCGVGGALTSTGSFFAWAQFAPFHLYFVCRRELPWRLMVFLGDAAELGILRQAGAYFQFRHAEVQERLRGGSMGSSSDPPPVGLPAGDHRSVAR